jgi:hypothetical protein
LFAGGRPDSIHRMQRHPSIVDKTDEFPNFFDATVAVTTMAIIRLKIEDTKDMRSVCTVA